jgi:hypothetical protein
MKASRVFSSAALLVALTASMAVAHPTSSRLEQRDGGRHERVWQGQRWNQHQPRFRQGRQGRMTRGEAARLGAGRAHIRQLERLAWADGVMTMRERLIIQRARMHQMRRGSWFRGNGRTA